MRANLQSGGPNHLGLWFVAAAAAGARADALARWGAEHRPGGGPRAAVSAALREMADPLPSCPKCRLFSYVTERDDQPCRPLFSRGTEEMINPIVHSAPRAVSQVAVGAISCHCLSFLASVRLFPPSLPSSSLLSSALCSSFFTASLSLSLPRLPSLPPFSTALVPSQSRTEALGGHLPSAQSVPTAPLQLTACMSPRWCSRRRPRASRSSRRQPPRRVMSPVRSRTRYVRFHETVQAMFITPLYQQHSFNTLASRVHGPQPHMRS